MVMAARPINMVKPILPGTTLTIALLLAAQVPSAYGQAPDLASLMSLVGERVQQYYDRVTSIVCTETVTQQELRSNLSPVSRPRETTYELIMVREKGEDGRSIDVRVERTLKSVNGRPTRTNARPECTDPRAVSSEPLEFLLPENQAKYRFSRADVFAGSVTSLALDFESILPDPVKVTWEGNCFTAEGGGVQGRVWLDAVSGDVLQLDTRLAKPFDIARPPKVGLGSLTSLRVQRSETTIRFGRVSFQNPEETLLLPQSMITTTIFRGAPNLHTTETFQDFRRFLSDVKIRGAA